MNKQTALATLSKGKFRITRTREALLDVMIALGAGRPFSAGDVFRKMDEGSRVDLVTIYRNLEVFEGAGLVCRADFNDDEARFTLAHGDHGHHHHHVVCRTCYRVAAIDECALAATEKALNGLGFTDLEHRLEFTGLCSDCR